MVGVGRVDVQQQVLHLDPGQRVQCAERLVEQEDARVAGQGAGQRGALGHAAGDFARAVLGELSRPTSSSSRATLALPCLALTRSGRPMATLACRVCHGSSRGSWNATAQRASMPCTGVPSISHAAGAGRVEAGGGAQQGGLAAAGRAQDGQHFAGADVEVDVTQHGVGFAPVPKVRFRPRKETGKGRAGTGRAGQRRREPRRGTTTGLQS